jgi:putative FmdB family regulatory protein
MPLYDYTCKKCEHSFEALVFGDEAVTCPQCEAEQVERQLSLPAQPRTGNPSLGGSDLPMACNSEGPPCGAPWCRRTG